MSIFVKFTFFHDYLYISNVFIKIHENQYENQIICISYHHVDVLCLTINLEPNLVF